MKITIAGMGNGGTTIAADLTRKGHQVTLLKTSDNLHNEHHKFMFEHGKVNFKDGTIQEEVKIHRITDNFEVALSDAEIIIVYIQTNFHHELINRMSPYFQQNQIILFEPGYLSTAYMLDFVEKNNITVVEAESSPIDCRITSPGTVEVLFKNVLNPIAVYPKSQLPYVKQKFETLAYPFVYKDSVVEVALHNPNLIVHTIGAIMSIPRIEYSQGDYWMYKEVFTPSVWKIVEALDNEKMNILEKLGYEPLPYVEACKQRNSLDKEKNAIDVFFNYANYSSPKGPSKVDTRYITEDVPEGLVLLESLGVVLNVDTKVCTSLIDLSSAALGRNFRQEGRNITKLGWKNVRKIMIGE